MITAAAGTPAQAQAQRPTAIVAAGVGESTGAALEGALERAQLEDALALTYAGCDRAAMQVAIKPLLAAGARAGESSRYADPQLAAALRSWLQAQGFSEASIAVQGEDGAVSALELGYTEPFLDLAADTQRFYFGQLIGEHEIARAWAAADMRILLASARTDPQLFYAGAMTGALSCVPDSRALAARLVSAHALAQASFDILERLPVAFYVLELPRGASAPGSRVLLSTDALALEWLLGELMDLDGPELNPLVREALQRNGPLTLDRRGDLTELDPWRNVGPGRAALCDLGAGRWWGRLAGWREVPWTDR
jgi:hypothetical protein